MQKYRRNEACGWFFTKRARFYCTEETYTKLNTLKKQKTNSAALNYYQDGQKMAKATLSLLSIVCIGLFLIVNTLSVNGKNPPILLQVNNPEANTGANFGLAVDGISDVNGDHISDLIVGAPGVDKVYLLSGMNRAVIRVIADPDGLSGNFFGYAGCAVGDLNGDGIEDVAVGAPGPWGILPLPTDPLNPHAESYWGRAFVFSGSTGALLLRLIPTDLDFFKFGRSLTSLGDVNGDGIPDVAVGAPVEMEFWGKVYAFSGMDGSQIWMSVESGPTASQRQPIASLGTCMATINDLNNDGKRELIVGAPFSDYDPDPNNYLLAGRAYVISGVDGTPLRGHVEPDSIQNDARFGRGVAAIGDQNGDSVEDYVIGEEGKAAIHIYSGKYANRIADITSPSGGSTDRFGFQIVADTDMDGDGVNDFWVSAPDGGKVYLLNCNGGLLSQINDPNPASSGNYGFGWAVQHAGDLDGDGELDLIIGKPCESVGGFGGVGAVFLLLSKEGSGPPLNVVPEVPLGAIVSFLALFMAFAGFVRAKRVFRSKR